MPDYVEYSEPVLLEKLERVHHDRFGLYKCCCGKEFKRKIGSVQTCIKHGKLVGCGCLRNRSKRKPFPADIIPDSFKDYIKPGIGSFPIGTKHHRQWFSEVKCLSCKEIHLVRNKCIIDNIKKYGYIYICQHCGGISRFIKRMSDDNRNLPG